MTTPAGIANYDGPGDDEQFTKVIANSPAPVQDLARAVRDLVYDVLPETVEVVWPHQGTVGWGTGPRKLSEHFAYLLPFRGHVTFGFFYGAELPDPSGLFGGPSANKGPMRSVRIATLDDVTRPALRELVSASTGHRVPPPRSRDSQTAHRR
ncbi:MAG: DUF1801 domain-containing protein [Chloroflexi bacterium]|nr:DUF1801 domain-containing protein [Chloroflexota bacterium]